MLYSRKIFALGFVILGLLVARGASAQESDPCLGMQSQAEMNACAADQYAKADAELNAVYRQLIAKYKSDAEFVGRLRLAQESWLRFRDADVTCFYYQKDKVAAYGSVYPTCRSRAMTHLTAERTKELKQMLDPQEGDVCAFVAAQEPAQETNPKK
jgi:uncharacterized protein YecT (DUF1311 family)